MSIGRPAHRNDDGNAVVVLPIFLLVVIAGIAALAGIALQPSESEATPKPTVTAAKLGALCTDELGAAPQRPAAFAAWVNSIAACIDDKMGDSLGSEISQKDAGYQGAQIVTTFQNTPRVVVRWRGEAPPALIAWASRHAGGVVAVVQTDT